MHLNSRHFPLNTNPNAPTVLRARLRRGSSTSSLNNPIPPRLQSYECFFNWAKNYPLTYNEVSQGLLLLEEKFRDESSEIDAAFLKSSGRLLASNYFILLVGRKLIQAHFNIEIGKFSQAKDCLVEVESFLSRWWSPGGDDDEEEDEGTASSDEVGKENNIVSVGGGNCWRRTLFPPEYAQGFTYILEGIKIFLEIQISSEGNRSDGGCGNAAGGSVNAGGKRRPGVVVSSSSSKVVVVRTSKISLDGLKHFKRLGPKAKYVVWTVRDVFFVYCSRSNVERFDWMELILEMEPYIPKWHFYLYRSLYGARKLVPRPAPVLLLQVDDDDDDDDDVNNQQENKAMKNKKKKRKERIVTSWSEEGIRLNDDFVDVVVHHDDDGIDDSGGGGNKQSTTVASAAVRNNNSTTTAHRSCISRVDPLSISYQAMCLTQMFVEKRSPPPPPPLNFGFSPQQLMLEEEEEQTELKSPTSSSVEIVKSPVAAAAAAATTTSPPVNLYPFRFGKTVFENPIQLLSVIQEKTIQVLEMDCHLDGVYLNFSEIQMFQLPPEHRSMELAIRCLKKALRLNNRNPKAHYRMGLANFKLKNHKQAIFHFREAIKEPNNIGAVFGLLQLLMSEPTENSEEIHSILRYAMKNRDLTKVWDKRCLRTLHYLKGCFHFMQQEKQDIEEAVTSWIIAHDNESPKWSYYFHNLSHQIDRFSWPTKRLNLNNVSNTLKHVAYLERTQFRQLLLDICSEVDDAIMKVDDQQQQQQQKRKIKNKMFTTT